MSSPWNRHAGQWSAIGPPLRPSDEDLVHYEAALRYALDAPGSEALLLGVTPELAQLLHHLAARLTAVDNNPAMVRANWPAAGYARGRVVLGDWRQMPAEDGAFHAAACDALSNNLPSASELRRALAQVHRVMKPGGILVVRHFIRPAVAEPTDAVFEDLLAGRIPSFHDFKWRLAQSLPQDLDRGLPVSEIYDAWAARALDADELAAARGWDPRTVRTIEAYRGVPFAYMFPTLAELTELYEPLFEVGAPVFPSYYLGARCPLITHRRR